MKIFAGVLVFFAAVYSYPAVDQYFISSIQVGLPLDYIPRISHEGRELVVVDMKSLTELAYQPLVCSLLETQTSVKIINLFSDMTNKYWKCLSQITEAVIVTPAYQVAYFDFLKDFKELNKLTIENSLYFSGITGKNFFKNLPVSLTHLSIDNVALVAFDYDLWLAGMYHLINLNYFKLSVVYSYETEFHFFKNIFELPKLTNFEIVWSYFPSGSGFQEFYNVFVGQDKIKKIDEITFVDTFYGVHGFQKWYPLLNDMEIDAVNIHFISDTSDIREPEELQSYLAIKNLNRIDGYFVFTEENHLDFIKELKSLPENVELGELHLDFRRFYEAGYLQELIHSKPMQEIVFEFTEIPDQEEFFKDYNKVQGEPGSPKLRFRN